MPRSERTYSTYEIAAMFDVQPHTVQKWFDRKQIDGHRLPPSGKNPGERRAYREALVKFVRDYALPMPSSLAATFEFRVVLVGVPEAAAAELHMLMGADGYRQERCDGLFAGGIRATGGVRAVVFNLALGRADGINAANDVRRWAAANDRRRPLLVALATEDDGRSGELETMGFDKALRQPLDLADLAEVLLAERAKGE